MNETEALNKMVAPGQRRKGKFLEGVIQIWLTRACDKACFHCTQGSNLRGKPEFITVENFEKSVLSLKDYFGVVGIFGGNPALHPEFKTLCEILKTHIPYKRRGIWCNNPLGKGKIMRETFNPSYSNLNVHLDKKAYAEFKRDWPESNPVGLQVDSRHSPVHLAMKDVLEDESKRWELISNCDINQRWSAMIGQFRGEARAWFCEIAGAQAMLNQHNQDYPDTGVEVNPDWWKKSMQDFKEQVITHCHNCAVPLRGYGELSQSLSGEEITSKNYEELYQPKKKDRPVRIAVTLEDLRANSLAHTTDYIQNGRK